MRQDLISRCELFNRLAPVQTLGEAYAVIQDMPTEPEREKGKWIPQDHNKTNGIASTLVYCYPKCSVCGHCDNYTNFCPNCGADMRGEENETD